MPRGLTSAVKTELATGKIRPVLLIEIGFSTPVYLTDASFDITSSVSGSSRTYLSNGHLQSISNINETNVPTKNTLSVSLSGVDQTYISVALNENIINKNVYIYKGFLDNSLSLISDPFLSFFGTWLVGFGSGIYLIANLGPGTRDGLMTGISKTYSKPISLVRFSIEFMVVFIGWLLGGTLGIGTIIFAVCIGPFVALSLKIVSLLKN